MSLEEKSKKELTDKIREQIFKSLESAQSDVSAAVPFGRLQRSRKIMIYYCRFTIYHLLFTIVDLLYTIKLFPCL